MFIEANGMEISLFIYFFIFNGFKKEEIGIFLLRSIFYGVLDFVGFYVMKNLQMRAIYTFLMKKVYFDLFGLEKLF
jgi:hypothetical protein